MKRSRSKRPSAPAAPSKPPATAPLSRSRRWLFRVVAMVLVPVLFLATLEAGLRLAGFGHPMSFFLPMKIAGQDCLVENRRFGWRFFGPDMARAPFPLAFPRQKPFVSLSLANPPPWAIPSRNSAFHVFWQRCSRGATPTRNLKSLIPP